MTFFYHLSIKKLAMHLFQDEQIRNFKQNTVKLIFTAA